MVRRSLEESDLIRWGTWIFTVGWHLHSDTGNAGSAPASATRGVSLLAVTEMGRAIKPDQIGLVWLFRAANLDQIGERLRASGRLR